MSIYRNILSNAGATAIGSLVQLVLILSLSRWLEVKEFAAFITATAVVGLGEMSSDFGVRIWATREFATKATSDGILGPAFLAKLGFSVFLVAIVLVFPFQLLNDEQALLAVLIACTQPSTDPLLWFMRGKERLDVEAVVTLLWRIGYAAILGALALLGSDVTLLLLAWLLCNMIRVWVEWYVPLLTVVRSGRMFEGRGFGLQVMNVVRLSFPIGFAFVVMALYQRLGVLMLGEISQPEPVAHFGAAFTLVSSAGFVATSITVSSFPRLAKAAAADDWMQVSEIANHKLWLIMMVFFPACLIGIIVAPWVVSILFPASYAPTSLVMMVLLPGLYISSINFALKYLMNTLRHNWVDAMSVLIGITVFVAIILSAQKDMLLQMVGLAWGVGEAFIFMVKWWVLQKDKRTCQIRLLRHLVVFVVLVCSFLILK